ncbi:MAG TPA: BNR-4 repeat-containing protein [Vicinamibacterales bacterium]|nr:BNR-4 repeat-containing protein [Vicinamibacterales bacterium]
MRQTGLAPFLIVAATTMLSTGAPGGAPVASDDGYPANYVAGSLVRLNDNGAWSWFMDPRAIVHDGRLIVGSVRSAGEVRASAGDPRWGNVEIAVYEIDTGRAGSTVLHERFEQDDHNAPSLFVRRDGRYLAVYTKHAIERRVYWRISEPGNPLAWGPAASLETPGVDHRPYGGDNVTYSNVFRLPDGRLVDFFRGYGHEPNYLLSDDEGTTWRYGGRLLRGKGGYSPYVKFASDGRGTIHIVATEDHPRNYDNSLYHAYLRDGVLHHSDGRVIGPLSTSTETTVAAWDLTKIFQGDPDNVAWMVDIEVDRDGRPCVLFSVQKDGRGLPPGRGGMDLRYGYACWDGRAWRVEEIAHAGTRLYPTEDDYSGLGALDPKDPGVVYISTNADPVTGAPLVSRADGQRHYELFRGRKDPASGRWSWVPITRHTATDNLRPIVPAWDDPRTALVWMRGRYVHNHGEWYTAVVALILPPAGAAAPSP